VGRAQGLVAAQAGGGGGGCVFINGVGRGTACLQHTFSPCSVRAALLVLGLASTLVVPNPESGARAAELDAPEPLPTCCLLLVLQP
jgi:hypothetical protein